LENILSSNIIKPKKLIKQKQTPNLLETTEQYRDFIELIKQISEKQKNDPIRNQIEKIENTDYQAVEEGNSKKAETITELLKKWIIK